MQRIDNFIFRCSEWLRRGNRANWFVFGWMVAFTFGKTLLFNAFAFKYDVEINAFEPSFRGVGSLMMKLSMAIFISSITFLLKDKRWLILLSVIIDTWCVANLIYMRNNYILLDAEAFNQSANLHGYWKSTFIYIEWGIDLLFYLLTALFSCVFIFTKQSRRSWSRCIWVVVIGIVLHVFGESCFARTLPQDSHSFNTLSRDTREKVYGTRYSDAVGETSVLESPMFIASDYAAMKRKGQPERPLTEADLEQISPFTEGNYLFKTGRPLIIVLLESLENWVCRPDVMPNLYRLANSEHVLYANRIHTQIVGAPSADGQMIVNTGLLPISAGATCLHYSHNEFPSLMNLTNEHTVCLLPHDPAVWNQTEMSPAYGYDTTIVFCDIDTLLFERLNQLVDEGERHIQCITQSTHAPFENSQYSNLQMPKNMPWVMSSYIRGFNALDDGLGKFIRKIETDERLRQYTIVITGDHRILHHEKREQMMRYCQKHGQDYNAQDDCLPLVIYSPEIVGNPHVTAEAYQMDIYPTVLHLLGAEQYDWKGFGVNLLDAKAIENRPFDSKEAARLSDKMIRNDYFRRYTRW